MQRGDIEGQAAQTRAIADGDLGHAEIDVELLDSIEMLSMHCKAALLGGERAGLLETARADDIGRGAP